MLGESRVALLNYICNSPLNCPVAVIFGHACTMNWAGPYYDDTGMELVNSLWCQGIPADMIPSSEIETKGLKIDDEGWISYGLQRYAAVILYHPEFEKPSTAGFFNRAVKGKTLMFRIGDWKKDFNCNPFDGNAALHGSMIAFDDIKSLLPALNRLFKKLKTETQTPAFQDVKRSGAGITLPARGFCRLIDGTLIQVAGTVDEGGDPIISTMKVNGYDVSFDAIGVAAVRLNDRGEVQSLAAGGLKSVKCRNFKIDLEERTDIALWINARGEWEGVLQGLKGPIPPQLQSLSNNLVILRAPVPFD
jgi:hypothetical protein